MPQPLLFTPLTIKGVTMKNRIVVAPMHQYSAVEGFATDWHLMNAGKYAAGGAGFVMMESTKVARNGCGTVGDTALWDDKFMPELARCAAFIKQHGAVSGIQLGHSGRKARLTRPWEGGKPLTGTEPELYDWEGWELVAPSAVPHTPKSPTPRALLKIENACTRFTMFFFSSMRPVYMKNGRDKRYFVSTASFSSSEMSGRYRFGSMAKGVATTRSGGSL